MTEKNCYLEVTPVIKTNTCHIDFGTWLWPEVKRGSRWSLKAGETEKLLSLEIENRDSVLTPEKYGIGITQDNVENQTYIFV